MKKLLIIILVISFILSGCESYEVYYYSPKQNNDEIWICEEPYLELYWNENKYGGKLILDEREYSIVHIRDHGINIDIYEDIEGVDYSSYKSDKYMLFSGIAKYSKEKMTITVDVDYKNLFDGEKPTFELVKHKKWYLLFVFMPKADFKHIEF